MKRFVRVFIGHVKANVWCLFHFEHCILTHQTKASGCWPQTDRIEVGMGSIVNGTWKTAKVFYANTRSQPERSDRLDADVVRDFEAKITPYILRNWDRERVVRFAQHLLGDECQDCPKHNTQHHAEAIEGRR